MNEQTELQVQTIRPQQVERVEQPNEPLDIVRLCVERNADVGVLERAMAIRRELQTEKAKQQFDEALANFQSKCPIIIKRKAGAKGAYKYAPLDAIVSQTRDLLRQEGFSFTVTSEIEGNSVKAICKITHRGGHSESSQFTCPVDNKNPMMTEPQRFGGAMTFARRYAFVNAFGILTADEDLDGADRPKPAGPSSVAPSDMSAKDAARELWNVLASVRGPLNNWKAANQWMWDEAVISDTQAAPDLTVEEFKQATAKAKAKLSRP